MPGRILRLTLTDIFAHITTRCPVPHSVRGNRECNFTLTLARRHCKGIPALPAIDNCVWQYLEAICPAWDSTICHGLRPTESTDCCLGSSVGLALQICFFACACEDPFDQSYICGICCHALEHKILWCRKLGTALPAAKCPSSKVN